jgi:gamma-glutamylcyclotransferase (GGCT)/AIG2-like uncharacterized protein YtfP
MLALHGTIFAMQMPDVRKFPMKNSQHTGPVDEPALPVFTYGSLMFTQVWQRVVRGRYRSEPAIAAEHVRLAIAGVDYPAMVARSGASVPGVLYFDVDARDIAALDAFEGADYRRVPLQVATASGATLTAHAYLYLPAQNLSESPWLPQAFDVARFIGAYCGDSEE